MTTVICADLVPLRERGKFQAYGNIAYAVSKYRHDFFFFCTYMPLRLVLLSELRWVDSLLTPLDGAFVSTSIYLSSWLPCMYQAIF